MVYTHAGGESLVLFLDKTFCEGICNLVSSWQVFKLDLFLLILLPQEMMLNLNVFGVVMELGVSGDRDGRLVIDVEGHRCVI